MSLVVIVILFAIAIILIGAVTVPKPIGYIAIGCAVLALLLALFGGASIRIGAAGSTETLVLA
jgi:hypothetical protein